MHHLVLTLAIALGQFRSSLAQCIADETVNTEFARIINGDDTSTSYSIDGSCCQKTICNLDCPEEVDPPASGKEIMNIQYLCQHWHSLSLQLSPDAISFIYQVMESL